jgi:undecaprenyl-diphosphatase
VLAIIKQILDWVDPLFDHAGYAFIALAVMLERSIFIGLIVPGDVFLALGGIYAAKHELSLPWVIVAASVAAIIGESVGFWLGRKVGARLIKRLPLVNRLEPKLEDAKEFFKKRGGGFTVAIGRYASAIGTFVPFVAGTGDMPYRKFLLFDIPAIIVWATGIALVGYYFGRNLDTVDKILSRFGYIMLGVLVAYIAARMIWKRVKKDR